MIEIQPGKYKAVPTCWGFAKSSNGHSQFLVEFKIRRSAAENDYVTMTKFIGLGNPKGEEILESTLRTCGWTGTDYGQIELDQKNIVEVVIEEDGNYGPKITYVNALDGPSPSLVKKMAMPVDEQAKLVAQLNARLRSSGAAATPAPARAPAPRQAPARAPSPPPQARQASDWVTSAPPAPLKPQTDAALPAQSDEDIPF